MDDFKVGDYVRRTVKNVNTQERAVWGPVGKVLEVRERMVRFKVGQYMEWKPKTAIRKLTDDEVLIMMLER